MDGFTALGIAANICQFIEYSYQIVNQVKALKDFGHVNPDLDRAVRQLKAVAATLAPESLPRHAGQMSDAASECVELSDQLLAEFSKLTPKDPKSKRQRLKAVLRTEYKKRDLADLEQKIDRCRSQLSLELAEVFRQARSSHPKNSRLTID